MLRRSLTALAFLGLLLATTLVHRQVPPTLRSQQGDDFVPRPEFAKVLATGFDAVLADYHWVQAVLLAGGQGDATRHSVQLGRLIDVVTTLDPWVDHPYRFAAVWMTDSRESVRKANVLLRRSFEPHPDEWRNRFYLGFNLFYYLQQNAEAAEVLEEATQLPGSPRYLPRLVARLRSESADLGAAAIFLEQLVKDAVDDGSRSEYQGALDEIEVEWHARELDRARIAYVELYGRDIGSVEDLVAGPHAILAALPSAEPSALPQPLRRGARWEIDAKTGQIQSSHYGRRYRLHIDEVSQRERDGLAERSEARSQAERAAIDSGAER